MKFSSAYSTDIAQEGVNMKIYLSPSAQPHNAYAVGNTTEQVQCNRIAAAAKAALERNGYIVRKAPEGQSYVKNVAESNAWGADIHMPIHTNAGGNNKGTLGLCYKGCVNNKYMQAVYEAVAECTPWPDMGIGVRSDLYEINKTNMMCVYIECAFHDKADSAQWIINNVTALGEAIAKGFCAADGKNVHSGRWQQSAKEDTEADSRQSGQRHGSQVQSPLSDHWRLCRGPRRPDCRYNRIRKEA